jgi:hypothetical protein
MKQIAESGVQKFVPFTNVISKIKYSSLVTKETETIF